MRDYDQSPIRIPGLGNKSHSGIARRRSLLVAATGPPTLSLLLLKCTDGDLGEQEGTHTERLHSEEEGGVWGVGGVINVRREFKQTLISVQVRGIKAAVHDHLIKPL